VSRCGQDPSSRKTNQDAALATVGWAPAGGATLLCVWDGHGPCGHVVSAHLKERFPATLAAHSAMLAAGDAEGAIRGAFSACDAGLRGGAAGIDTDYSGSTAVVAVLDTSRRCVTVGWTGDSRAVVGRRCPAPDGPDALAQFHAVPLTHDHKPDNPAEAARIAAAGGRVEQLVDDQVRCASLQPVTRPEQYTGGAGGPSPRLAALRLDARPGDEPRAGG